MMLSGWGRYPRVECKTLTLRETDEVKEVLARSKSLIPRGNGRAYGDAAINPETTLMMNRCDRFLDFDTTAGLIECEAGVLLGDFIEVTMARGWFPPVVPGTRLVTIGGLIAADVHGKNHHVDGSFGTHVESLRLALADGTIVQCSRLENSDLFEATLGGMGLTGIILSARIRLRPITSSFIQETVIRAPSLDALLRLLDVYGSANYSVAWIDCLARERHFGRGILMLGEHAKMEDLLATKDTRPRSNRKQRLSIPIELPISPLSPLTIKFFNQLYYWLHGPKQRFISHDDYFFPLDAVQNWNYIYGRRGFVQYQFVIGGTDSERGLRRILGLVNDMGTGTFLAVLKKLGPGNRFLSFPMDGYTLTLDFPVRSHTMIDLAKLDAILTEYRGRIYLAKDARAPRELIERGYPEIEAFRKLRREIDPARKIRSALSERLAL